MFKRFTNNGEELDNHDESCKLYGRPELEWALIFFFFIFIHRCCWFFSWLKIIEKCCTRKTNKHHRSRNPYTREYGWIDNPRNHNYSDKHNTRSYESSHDIRVPIFWMFGTFFGHCNGCCCWWDESTDRTRGHNSSFGSNHTREDKTSIFDTRHNHYKEPDSIRIKKWGRQNRVGPTKWFIVKPMCHIHNGKLGIWKKGKYYKGNHSEFERIAKFFTRESSFDFGKVFFRWKYDEYEDCKYHGNSGVPTHSNYSNKICQKCGVFARNSHFIFWKRWVSISNHNKKSWYEESAYFPDIGIHRDIHPSCNSTKKWKKCVWAYSAKSNRSTSFDSCSWHFSFRSYESPESSSKDKIPENNKIHKCY